MKFSNPLPLSVLTILCGLEAQTKVSVERARAMIEEFANRLNSPDLRLEFTYSRRSSGLNPERICMVLWGRERGGSMDCRLTRFDDQGKTRSVNVFVRGQQYQVVRGEQGWHAVSEKTPQEAIPDIMCPVIGYMHSINGRAWGDALQDHPIIEAYQSSDAEQLLCVRMPLSRRLSANVKAGKKVRGFLCWEAAFSLDEAGYLRLRRVRNLGSREVSDRTGQRAGIPNPLAMEVDGPVAPVLSRVEAVVMAEVTFNDFVKVGKLTIPMESRRRSREVESVATIEKDSLKTPADGQQRADVFAFRAPKSFGPVGTWKDARVKKTKFFGPNKQSEDEILEKLRQRGRDLVGDPGGSGGRWWWLFAGVAAGAAVIALMSWARARPAVG